MSSAFYWRPRLASWRKSTACFLTKCFRVLGRRHTPFGGGMMNAKPSKVFARIQSRWLAPLITQEGYPVTVQALYTNPSMHYKRPNDEGSAPKVTGSCNCFQKSCLQHGQTKPAGMEGSARVTRVEAGPVVPNGSESLIGVGGVYSMGRWWTLGPASSAEPVTVPTYTDSSPPPIPPPPITPTLPLNNITVTAGLYV